MAWFSLKVSGLKTVFIIVRKIQMIKVFNFQDLKEQKRKIKMTSLFDFDHNSQFCLLDASTFKAVGREEKKEKWRRERREWREEMFQIDWYLLNRGSKN